LFPGLAIADEIRRRVPDAEITFVGTKEKIEARVVPQRGYPFAPIWISGFRRKPTLGNLLFPAKVLVAVVQSFFLLKKINPAVVVGTGGYACGPPLFVAQVLRLPTLIQEQNSIPGVTTRLLATRASEVHLSFEMTRKALKRQENIRVSGNPTVVATGRVNTSDGLAYFNLAAGKKTLLVFGGSLGASTINAALAGILPALLRLDIQIIWQTGETDFAWLKAVVDQMPDGGTQNVRLFAFVDEMRYAYAACNLAVCRAGATTLAELTCLGVPSILVPYPHAAADHQRLNASMMVQEEAAVMIEDGKLEEKLFDTIEHLMADSSKRKAMAENARRLGRPDAAATVADAVLSLAQS
jgi:UDP-N-acetylglucosamine--N-acetylmuramyl-(pentapeptide) pyrophosphoryl-undecaprenol N-acetylglucosamine transferase